MSDDFPTAKALDMVSVSLEDHSKYYANLGSVVEDLVACDLSSESIQFIQSFDSTAQRLSDLSKLVRFVGEILGKEDHRVSASIFNVVTLDESKRALMGQHHDHEIGGDLEIF